MRPCRAAPEHLYLLPVGGTAMASLAGLLAAAGHRVEGVDAQLYPPMSTMLAQLDVCVRLGWDPKQIPTGVDRVIIGNAVPRSNPEVDAVLRRGLPFLSQAAAVPRYLLGEDRRSVVVAGTHGKTTTAALLAWTFEQTGLDPTCLVGGLLSWSGRSFRWGAGEWVVLEGDEYNTAFFDRRPKLHHYRPHILLLGPVEYDHADIYPSLDAVLAAFRAGTALVPPAGLVIVNATSSLALEVAATARCRVLRVGPTSSDDLQTAAHTSSQALELSVADRATRWSISSVLAGDHNALNLAMAFAAATAVGIEPARAAHALSAFPGVGRRLEVVGERDGVLVVDDFAHHPTALAATVRAARQRWPDRRLVVAYEPRSLTAGRRLFQEAYVEALAPAALALVPEPHYRHRLGAAGCLDREALAATLGQLGTQVLLPAPGADPLDLLRPALRPGDLVLVCSSGDFAGLARRAAGMAD